MGQSFPSIYVSNASVQRVNGSGLVIVVTSDSLFMVECLSVRTDLFLYFTEAAVRSWRGTIVSESLGIIY